MALVTTGQITIVDQNDAKPLTAYITASPGKQQVYNKDESTITWSPDWTTANANLGIILTAKVYAGGVGAAVDVTGLLTNRKFSTDLSTAITGTAALVSSNAALAAIFVQGAGFTFTTVHNSGGSTLTVKSNILDTVPGAIIYFTGDYTDPATGLTTTVIAQIDLGLVKTGTNAVYVLPRGQDSIQEADGATKNVAVIAVDLMRASGVDVSGVTYQFYENNGATQIYNGGGFTTKYGMKSTSFPTGPTGSASDVGTGLPASGGWSANNTLVIHESAITDIGTFRAVAKDADGTTYQTYFTVYDVSDPYDLKISSTTGDKLQNGTGSTTLTPIVYNGAAQVSDLTGWSFLWTFYNRNGKRGAFIDTTITAQAGGRSITANSTGTSATLTYSGAAFAGVSAGMIAKAVKPDGTELFYEIASVAGSVLTIRTPSTNTWLNFTDFPAPTTTADFVGGKLFICVGSGGQRTTSGAAGIVVTGDEIDVKGVINIDATRP